ncbi:hypothetical protein V8C42DRAFT_311365 [Trichoderma barbatum]
MMMSSADSSLDLGSTPARFAAQDSAALAPAKPEKLVVTTREPKAAPATILGGLFKEAVVDLDASGMSSNISTTIVTSTTRVTRTVTVVPTRIVTVTAFPSSLAKESNLKALIPLANGTASANPPRTTLSNNRFPLMNVSSAAVDSERERPEITRLGLRTSSRLSLSATSSGFRTLRRAA